MLAASGLAALALALAAPAGAQTAAAPAATGTQADPTAPLATDQGGLADVVVTARKREESLNTVPLSISALGAADIESQGIKTLFDIARSTPSFQFVQQSSAGAGQANRALNQLTFRGLAFNGNFGATAGGLAFVDGAPIINAQPPALLDVERVEVLKGPQSAYFGRSTFAGAINFVTTDPSFDLHARATAEASSYDSHDLGASVEDGIIPGVLAARVGVHYNRTGGQYTSAKDAVVLGTQTTRSVSGQFLFTPASNLRFKGFVSYEREIDGAPAQAVLETGRIAAQSNCNLGGSGGRFYCGTLPTLATIRGFGTISGNYRLQPNVNALLLNNGAGRALLFSQHLTDYGLRQNIFQANLNGALTFANGMTLSTVTAYHSDRYEVLYDLYFGDPSTLTPNRAFPSYGQVRIQDFTQEVRLTSRQTGWYRWTAGLNFFTVKQDTANSSAFISANNSATYTLSAQATGATENQPYTYSAFGALYVDPFPNLHIGLEGRYQIDKVIARSLSGASNTTVPPFSVLTYLKNNFRSFSPRATVDYEFMPKSIVYAQFARGTRPGGFNTSIAAFVQQGYGPQLTAQGADITNIAFREETLTNYEVGLKTRFLNDRANLAISLYREDYRKAQTPGYYTVTQTNGIPTTISLITNSGSVDLKGVEVEGQLRPIPPLTLSGNFAWNYSRINSYNSSDSQAISGRVDGANGKHLAQAPEFTGNFSAQYNVVKTVDNDVYLRGDYYYRGKSYVDLTNYLQSRADNRVNLRLGARIRQLTLEVFVNNVFDSQVVTGLISSPADLLGAGGILNGPYAVTTQGTNNQIKIGLPERRSVGIRTSIRY